MCVTVYCAVSDTAFCGAGEFGMVYRARLAGWQEGPPQIVAVKTLKGLLVK